MSTNWPTSTPNRTGSLRIRPPSRPVISTSQNWPRGGHDCLTHELYAETAETLIFSRYATQTRWVRCTTVPDKVTDEAIEVVRQAFSGQMPQWFYGTFHSDGNPDYESIWAAVGRVRGRSQLAVINQLRYSYGGYCSEANVLEIFVASEGSFPPGQPWRDGGCDN